MNNEERAKELLENRTSATLHINRLPVEIKKEFKEFAKNDFCNDFGFAFKHIWDFYKGIMDSSTQELNFRVENVEDRLLLLEENLRIGEPKEEPKVTRKSISGKPL